MCTHLVEIQTLTEVASSPWLTVHPHLGTFLPMDEWSGVPPSATWSAADYAHSIRSWAWICWKEVHLQRYYIRGSDLPGPPQFHTWNDLLHITVQQLSECRFRRLYLSREVPLWSGLFSNPNEASRPVKAVSRPATLWPKYDEAKGSWWR